METPRLENYHETVDYLRKHYAEQPQVGIVLGTGLAGLVDCIEVEKTLAYNFIPHFPLSTVESHFGKLIFGHIGPVRVVAMQGRMHYYEGYRIEQVVYPIRILRMLGIHTLFLSNAAGGLNLGYNRGDLMLLEDHINLQPDNPLRGINLDYFGPRFPDMSQPYDPQLRQLAHEVAAEMGFALREGVYVCVQGPNLETRAEYRWLRSMGADVVGMSTVPEVIAARHMGLRVCALSVVTDLCDPDHLEPVTVQEIVAVAGQAEPKLTQLLQQLVIRSSSPA